MSLRVATNRFIHTFRVTQFSHFIHKSCKHGIKIIKFIHIQYSTILYIVFAIMADIFEDNSDNEELDFANKEWNKLNKSLQKDGLKDGIHLGRESGLQKGFDLGFEMSFKPFLTISSFEAIIDVLLFNLKTEKDNEVISQMKTIKSNIRHLYELTESHLLSLETNKLDSNCIELNEEIISLFESTKQLTIKLCKLYNFESILHLINNLFIS